MNDPELDKLLQLSKSTLTPDTAFQRDVWRRIETAEDEGFIPQLNLLAERFFNWLAFPPVALATCSVMLAAGVWTGLLSGNQTAQGETSYIQSVSPFAHSQHR